MGGFYNALSESTMNLSKSAAVGIAVGAAAGAASGLLNRRKKSQAAAAHETVTLKDLQREDQS